MLVVVVDVALVAAFVGRSSFLAAAPNLNLAAPPRESAAPHPCLSLTNIFSHKLSHKYFLTQIILQIYFKQM